MGMKVITCQEDAILHLILQGNDNSRRRQCNEIIIWINNKEPALHKNSKTWVAWNCSCTYNELLHIRFSEDLFKTLQTSKMESLAKIVTALSH